jgi:hypothetical protein
METSYRKAICQMCGNKSMFVPMEYFLEKLTTTNEPEQAQRLKGIRILFTEETAESPYPTKIIKNKNVSNIKYQHKYVMVLKKRIPLTYLKSPVRADTVETLFESQAVFDAPFYREEQIKERKFPRDVFYNRKLPIMCDAMLWVFFNYYQHYINEGF